MEQQPVSRSWMKKHGMLVMTLILILACLIYYLTQPVSFLELMKTGKGLLLFVSLSLLFNQLARYYFTEGTLGKIMRGFASTWVISTFVYAIWAVFLR
jgi:hypothetical protein